MEKIGKVSRGAWSTYPIQCSTLGKGRFVMLKGRPCKIVEMSTSENEHGHAEVHLVGLDLFTNKQYEDLCPPTQNIDVPIVSRTDFQLIRVNDDGFVTLMDYKGDTRSDLKIPDGDLESKIRHFAKAHRTVLVTVMSALGEETIIACKNDTS